MSIEPIIITTNNNNSSTSSINQSEMVELNQLASSNNNNNNQEERVTEPNSSTNNLDSTSIAGTSTLPTNISNLSNDNNDLLGAGVGGRESGKESDESKGSTMVDSINTGTATEEVQTSTSSTTLPTILSNPIVGTSAAAITTPTSTTTPPTTSNTTTTTTKSASPVSSIPAINSTSISGVAATKTITSSSTSPKKKKKKGGLFSSLFSCFSSNNFEEDSKKNDTKVMGGSTSASSTGNKIEMSERRTKNPNNSAFAAGRSNKDKENSNNNNSTSNSKPPSTITTSTSTGLDNKSSVSSSPPPSQSQQQQQQQQPQSQSQQQPSQSEKPIISPPRTRRRRSGKKPLTGTAGIITSLPQGNEELEEGEEDGETGDEEDTDGDENDGEESEDEEQRLIAKGGVGVPIGEDGQLRPLLPGLTVELSGRKCLVLDLDETLVHSSFKPMVHQADYIIPVQIEGQYHNVYVLKRPGVDGFLKAMGEIYEVVVYTASLSLYADPVLDQLDIHRVVSHRLFRESCYSNKGVFVKDLSQLGRPRSECIIIDNSPACCIFQPTNSVPISSWYNDPHDTELTDLIPFLTDLSQVGDVRSVLDSGLYRGLNDLMQELVID